MNNCDKCKELGLEFNRRYKPDEFIEGKPNSKIWIVGLNPAVEEGWLDKNREATDLANYFQNLDNIHRYFKGFKKVSSRLFEQFGKDNGVAHTDLVKCSSKSWPPKSCKGKKANVVINNCKSFLFDQIEKHKPEMIICNGAPVSHQIKGLLKPDKWLTETSYKSKVGNQIVFVILSGFIGRIDGFSKRRLGYEIEELFHKLENPNNFVKTSTEKAKTKACESR